MTLLMALFTITAFTLTIFMAHEKDWPMAAFGVIVTLILAGITGSL